MNETPTEEIREDDILKISTDFSPKIIIVDNIYENPDEVRKFALSRKFIANDKYHKGERSGSRFLPKGMKELFEKFLGKKITKWEPN